MSFFKNDKMVKKEEIIVTQNSVRVVMTPEELLAQEYEEGVEDILKQTIIVPNNKQKALLAEAVELFGKILKGYPVSDSVKVWVEKASKEL